MHIQNSSTWGKLPNTDSYCLVIARHHNVSRVLPSLLFYRPVSAHDASGLHSSGHDLARAVARTTVIAYATLKKA